ncbi:hypothetical protein [Paenibacillus glucanolyticus]|uniref:hypothetical protein n=1 Tax=Paenibacillus glucanolyticus TaxID=59843 RepID=UPI00096CE584|nr:hypothetical protein [Paenibacillus glucanolyticus]OMF76793.1 hypothetical protein BK142_14845 [Paenibacillus glucanolyticus]
MSKNTRQSIKVKGQKRPIPFPSPVSDKRKARKFRRRIGKVMAKRLNSQVPGALLFSNPLRIDLDEQVKLGNIDIGHLTWDGSTDEFAGLDTDYGFSLMRNPRFE